MPIARTSRRPGQRGSAFTLIELLVVIAVIAIVGAIVLTAFRGIARDARLSSGTNTVIAALGNARALAMKNNRLVLVVFRPRMLDERTQVVEIVTAQWTGDTFVYTNDVGDLDIIDRFLPIQGAPVRTMPRGVKVAGPLYVETDLDNADPQTGFRDDQWGTQSELAKITGLANSEAPGRLIGVMFSPTGAVVSSNAVSSADASYIDFDKPPTPFDPIGINHNGVFYNLSSISTAPPSAPSLAEHFENDDEPVVTFAPFVAVYDDEELRELSDATSWTGGSGRAAFEADLRLYLTENASRIHFNSYTGVALR
jgi:prepilin-type N-terminal cleavage/methylation domain-containing protein